MKQSRFTSILPFSVLFYLFFIIISTVSSYAADDCPQKRRTREAPPEYSQMKNPIKATKENIAQGKDLYLKNAKPAPCYRCHGKEGKADSRMAKLIRPRPRIFTCKETMDQISDGQAFWVIRKGSKGSGMAGYPSRLLSDEHLWKIMLYVRSLAK